MIIAYRDATLADADALSAVGKQSFIETFAHLYSPDDLENFLDNHAPEQWATLLANPDYDIRLAETDGQFVGYARIGPNSLPVDAAGKTPWELKQLYILQPWQGAGIAPVLMDWAMEQARARGGDAMFLSVYSENHRAQKFYARYGFTFVKPHIFMVGNQADEDEIWSAAL